MLGQTIRNNTGHTPVRKLHKISCVAADFADNSEVDSGYDLPVPCVVLGVYVDVTAAETTASTKTISVGLLASETNGDLDGFVAGLSVATAVTVVPTLADGAATLGALLRVDESGGDLVPEAHAVVGANAKSVSVTAGDASGFTEAAFDVYIETLEPDA